MRECTCTCAKSDDDDALFSAVVLCRAHASLFENEVTRAKKRPLHHLASGSAGVNATAERDKMPAIVTGLLFLLIMQMITPRRGEEEDEEEGAESREM